MDIQKKTAHALEQEREDVLKRRQDWFDRQPDLDPQRLVFIDETSLSTKMARLRGRSLRGERCRAGVPHGHWKTTLRRERESGERTPRRQGKPRGSRLDAHEAFIAGMIEAQKDITLHEMIARLESERAVRIGRSMLSRWLRQQGWTFKKRPLMHWSRSVKTF